MNAASFSGTLLRRRLFVILLAEVALLAVLYVGARWLKDSFRSINRNIMYDPVRVTESKLQMPPLDPVLDDLAAAAIGGWFDFSESRGCSEVILALRQCQLGAGDVLLEHDYESMTEFLRYLWYLGRHSDEFEVLEAWRNRIPAEQQLFPRHVSHFLWYLEDSYIEPIADCLKNSQGGRARWLAHEAGKRIRLLNTPPLTGLDPYSRERVNEILLAEALLWQPAIVFGYPEEVNRLLEIATSHFPDSEKDSVVYLTSAPELESLRNYWLGVYEFRRKSYSEAWRFFCLVSEQRHNRPLRELSLLMRARCLFWAHEKAPQELQKIGIAESDEQITDRVITSLQVILDSLSEDDYRSAVRTYADYLKGTSDAPKTWIPLDSYQ